MKKESLIFFLSLLALSVYLLYEIFSPFLAPILWAILLAIIFYPLFQKIRSLLKEREFLSALICTLLVALFIALPLSFLLFTLSEEVTQIYGFLDEVVKTGRLQAYLDRLQETPILKRLGLSYALDLVNLSDLLLRNLQQVSAFFVQQTTKLVRGLSAFILGYIVSLLSLFYFFRDGAGLVQKGKGIIPIPASEIDLFLSRFREMARAIIYGGVLIAIIQGALGGLAFWVLGISSPVFWGMIMFFISFIPFGGTALVWGPAAVILLTQGSIGKGVGLIIFGTAVIGTVDNLLRPVVMSTHTRIHPLLLFFAVLGGIDAFGIIGLIAGPLVVTFALTLLEIYVQRSKT